ncbi:MAG: MATE family efflux transporter [Clostridia bacterium]|nr:MATE family efflux transporter [Clostridia bacterium]
MAFFKRFIGDRSFYKKVFAVSIPMMVQMGITNFVSLLDNIMVGKLGTEAMSGVSIVNQFVFVFNLLIFGAVSAAGIFTAQYHGIGDTEGERYTFRFKFLINVLSAVAAILAFIAFDDELISLFLHDGSEKGDLALTLAYGKEYLKIMLWGMIPYAVSQVYTSTMRETEQTITPMIASVSAVFINFIFNYILIFGKFGAPALGIEGAAIATVISRFAELGILLFWGHTHKTKCPYLIGAFRSFRIPKMLFIGIVAKGLPLMANEFLWSLAVTFRNQAYSTRGLDVVAGLNICTTILNVFNVVYMAVGASIAIIIGNLLGAGKTEEAKDADRKMLAFSVTCGTVMGLILIACSHAFPMIYNTSDEVRTIAAQMMIASAVAMPFCAFAHSSYFTLRSGGQVMITLLFDSVYMWVIVLPVALILAHLTNLPIIPFYAICQCTDILKAGFGYALLKRGTWIRQLVSYPNLKKQ